MKLAAALVVALVLGSRPVPASPGLPPPAAAIGTIGVESLSHAASANIAKNRPRRRSEPIVDGSADMSYP